MENQRIRLSKKLLKDALIELLQKKSLEKISIYELCSEAGINRTTFYKYYGNQYDLLADIENDIFEELSSRLPSEEDTGFGNLESVLEYLNEERRKCLVFINSTPDKDFPEKLFSLPIIQASIAGRMTAGFSRAEQNYLHIFLCHGMYSIITKWINSENRESVVEIADLIRKLSMKIFAM